MLSAGASVWLSQHWCAPCPALPRSRGLAPKPFLEAHRMSRGAAGSWEGGREAGSSPRAASEASHSSPGTLRCTHPAVRSSVTAGRRCSGSLELTELCQYLTVKC